MCVEIATERADSERVFVDPARKPYEAERRESRLVKDYEAFLNDRGHKTCRNRIAPAGELKPLFTDLYDKTGNVLIEAKGSVTREEFRMALGQMLDYRRFLAGPACAILAPFRPRADRPARPP